MVTLALFGLTSGVNVLQVSSDRSGELVSCAVWLRGRISRRFVVGRAGISRRLGLGAVDGRLRLVLVEQPH